MSPPPRKKPVHWRKLLSFVSYDLLMPLSPKGLELIVLILFSLGPVVILDRTFAVSAIMIPAAAIVRGPKQKIDVQRVLYTVFLAFGMIFWTLAIAFADPSNPRPKEEQLCYDFSGYAVVAASAILIIDRFCLYVLHPFWNNRAIRRAPTSQGVSP